MGRGKKDTEANARIRNILGNNIRKIVERCTSTHSNFYMEYFYKLYQIPQSSESARSYVNRLLDGIKGREATQTATYEELLLLSDLAGVSINELLTEEIDLDSEPRTLRDILRVLFILLDRMHFKPHQVTSKGITGYIISPRLKPTTPEYNDYVFGHIINEFLKEYEQHKRDDSQDAYNLWRRRVLEGAFSYSSEGKSLEWGKTTDEAKLIVENAKNSRRKATEEFEQAIERETAEREQFLDTNICGYSEAEWDAMTEAEREATNEEMQKGKLEDLEETNVEPYE